MWPLREWEREARSHCRHTGTVQLQESLGHRLLTALDVLVPQSGKRNKSQPLQMMGEAEQRGEAALVSMCNPFIQSVSQSDLESQPPPDVTATTLCGAEPGAPKLQLLPGVPLGLDLLIPADQVQPWSRAAVSVLSRGLLFL